MDEVERTQGDPETPTTSTTCQKEPKPCRTGTGSKPRIRYVGELIECLEPKAAECPYSLSFGLGFFCKCHENKLPGSSRD